MDKKEESRLHYKRIFDDQGPDPAGTISINDVVRILREMGRNVNLYDLENALPYAKTKTSNRVNFDDFFTLLSQIYTPEEEMYLVFQHFDKDGDGYISPGELKELLWSMGDEVTEQDLSDMISEADQDGDGLVSFEEFVRVTSHSQRPPDSVDGEPSDETKQELATLDDDTEKLEEHSSSSSVDPKETHDGNMFPTHAKRRRSCFPLGRVQTFDMPDDGGLSQLVEQRPRSLSSCTEVASFGKSTPDGKKTPRKKLSLISNASFWKGFFKKKEKQLK